MYRRVIIQMPNRIWIKRSLGDLEKNSFQSISFILMGIPSIFFMGKILLREKFNLFVEIWKKLVEKRNFLANVQHYRFRSVFEYLPYMCFTFVVYPLMF